MPSRYVVLENRQNFYEAEVLRLASLANKSWGGAEAILGA